MNFTQCLLQRKFLLKSNGGYDWFMRIASLSPAATEILFALGANKEIVCVDQFSNDPDAAKKIPHIRGLVDVNPDALKEFQPDVVLLGTSIQKKLSEKLKAAGYSVIFDDPRSIRDIYEWIRALGALFNRVKEGEALVLSMQQGLNDVKRKAALLPRKPRIYIEEWHDPPYASGNWVPEIASLAGGVQLPVTPGELSPRVTLDQVQKFDPDLVVISWCGAGDLAPKELFLKRSGWETLRAIQTGQVRVIDDDLLNRPGPRLVEGARRLYGWAF